MNAISDAAWQREQARLRPTLLTLESLDPDVRPDPALFWVPESLTPLWGTDGYDSLTTDQRRRYNQFYAQQLAEEFAWIETHLITAPLNGLRRRLEAGSARGQVLDSFIADETHHIACFEHLAEAAALATGHDQTFYRPPALVRGLAKVAARAPEGLSFWVEAVQAFENYALSIGQAYQQADDLDPMFRDTFIHHARDEARHCQYDALLSEWLVEGQGAVRASLTKALHRAFTAAYYDVRWGLVGPIRALAASSPQLAVTADALLQQAKTARESNPPALQSDP